MLKEPMELSALWEDPKKSTKGSGKKIYQPDPELSTEPGQAREGVVNCLLVRQSCVLTHLRKSSFGFSRNRDSVKLSQKINVYCQDAQSTKETGSQKKSVCCLQFKASPVLGLGCLFSPSIYVFLFSDTLACFLYFLSDIPKGENLASVADYHCPYFSG